MGWLEANRPPPSRPALMHGDYSPYKVMASPGDTRRLAAVVDWDTGTTGDPLLDLGHLLGVLRPAGRGRVRALRPVHVLVNNAGMSPLYPDLASVTEEA